jgi:hypothetical protein
MTTVQRFDTARTCRAVRSAALAKRPSIPGLGSRAIHAVARERAANGTPASEAVVLFGRDPKTGASACVWMDNTAAADFPSAGTGRGSVTGDSIPFVFHYTAATSFHTTFVYDRAADSWQWHMDSDSAGVRKPFARVTLTRR